MTKYPQNTRRPRNRFLLAGLIVVVVFIGLSSRKFPQFFPGYVTTYVGDTLWATNVFLLLCFFFPKISAFRATLIALAFSFLIEISQFYHAPWIDAIRATTLGGLVLGYTFVWRDLLCYTVGVVMGLLIDMWLNNDSGTVENQSVHG